jgi:outer membrane protein assembly factor BamE
MTASTTADFRFQRTLKAVFAVLMIMALSAASGCVYRISIQQGNFLQPKDIDRVTLGMTRVQVRALLGTPMVADPFEGWRWDYVYYFKQGRLKKPTHRQFTVFFEDDKVVRVDRFEDGKPVDTPAPVDATTPADAATPVEATKG